MVLLCNVQLLFFKIIINIFLNKYIISHYLNFSFIARYKRAAKAEKPMLQIAEFAGRKIIEFTIYDSAEPKVEQ